jgi:hypothetical protein
MIERVSNLLRRRYAEQPKFDTGEPVRPRLGIDERRVRDQLRPHTGQVSAAHIKAPARITAARRVSRGE